MNSLCKGLIMKRICHVQEPEIDHWVCSTVSKDRSGMKPAWRGVRGCHKVTLMDTHIVRHKWSSSLRSSLWPLLKGSLFSLSTVLAICWSLAWGSYIEVNNPPSNRCQTNQSESRVEQRRLGKRSGLGKEYKFSFWHINVRWLQCKTSKWKVQVGIQIWRSEKKSGLKLWIWALWQSTNNKD